MRLLRRWLLPALLVAVSCGPPGSKHPLTDPAAAKADPRLAGTFVGALEGARTVLHLFPKTGASLDLVLVGDDKEKGAAVLVFDAFPSVVGGRTYLNLRSKTFQGPYGEDPKLAEEWIFARYEVSPRGALTLWVMTEDEVKAAVEAGKLQGQVTEGDVHLTASSPELAAFVAAADPAKLFNRFGTFQKQADPAPARRRGQR